MSDSSFDFQYALENTRILKTPDRSLETFGTTRVRYHLITEVMDAVDKVRIREGTLDAAQPRILTPGHLRPTPIEGFADDESEAFMQWLKQNHPGLRFLQYGFSIRKQDVQDTVIHESLSVVKGNVLTQVTREGEPFSAVVEGVDTPWEVCLLKLMVDLVESSIPHHVSELRGRNLLPNPDRGQLEIQEEFASAERDPSRIPYLHKKLRERGVFDQYQDRFFELVRRSGGDG